MNLALIAGAWLLLGVTFCLVSGRGLRTERPDAEPIEAPVAPAVPRQFIAYPVYAWARVAHDISTDELLSTRPGAIRRVATK